MENAGFEPGPAGTSIVRFVKKQESRVVTGPGARPPALPLPSNTIPSPKPIVDGLLHEGMLLFGGKGKRGKSWLMLDLALSVATDRRVWGHFTVPEPQPVLYMALEDSRGRIQRRLHEIRLGIRTNGQLQLLYNFPLLNDGGLDELRRYITSGRYRLIVIDVLAKAEDVFDTLHVSFVDPLTDKGE